MKNRYNQARNENNSKESEGKAMWWNVKESKWTVKEVFGIEGKRKEKKINSARKRKNEELYSKEKEKNEKEMKEKRSNENEGKQGKKLQCK